MRGGREDHTRMIDDEKGMRNNNRDKESKTKGKERGERNDQQQVRTKDEKRMTKNKAPLVEPSVDK